jgi:hypothetical protein
MLIFAPSTKEQRNHISIGHTIRDCIDAAYYGDIAYLFHSAMQVRQLKQNNRPTYNKTAVPNRLRTMMSIKLLFPELVHCNLLPP